MHLTVRLFAGLRERAGRDELLLEDLPDGLDLARLKAIIEERFPGLGSLAAVAGVVGTEYVTAERRIEAGEEVALLPPVSGGTSAPSESPGGGPCDPKATVDPYPEGLFELSAGPLDPGAAQGQVVHSSCGAVATFVGTTRDTNRGESVEWLEYEAFDAMTAPEMARIFERCRARFGDPGPGDRDALRMLCQHRVGRVDIGQPSVVIAVASPHRDTAFAACRFLIDELKQTLPIWKREIYADGHHWIGERS